MSDAKKIIENGEAILGIELGSTRIKAVLIDPDYTPLSYGEYVWENRLENGYWTYHLDEIHEGLKESYRSLVRSTSEAYGARIRRLASIGISAMMHGYFPLDENGQLLVPFRTWRNTTTEQAAAALTREFGFNIPQRWSIAHLYQAMLDHEAHVPQIARITTLAGYIHLRLTGENVLGIGEASGMFPIDSEAMDYNADMLDRFDALSHAEGYTQPIRELLPRAVPAGGKAGVLTAEGAAFLDPTGELAPGCILAPPEGDVGTGMTATNSVRPGTGNVSAGTSDFAMIVLDRPVGVHEEIDMVTTPDGMPAAMVHCNNCTSDINDWVGMFAEFANACGVQIGSGDLYELLFKKALEGDADAGGLLSYNYISGEGVTKLDRGMPLFLRRPDAKLTLANFMRMHLLSAMATLKIGMDILTKEESVPIRTLYGHGGFFKTPDVGARILSAAVSAPISVMTTAGEGGAYGIALLAAYALQKEADESLPDFLEKRVFAEAQERTVMADAADIQGFSDFLRMYQAYFPVERLAAETE